MSEYRSDCMKHGAERSLRLGPLPLMLTLLAAVVGARAQYPVQQDGRIFDANPQLGSGGYNAGRPVSPLLLGNEIVGGTIRGGLAFRGPTQVGSSTTFLGPLGSSALSGFQRDSVSVADAYGPAGGPLGLPYYDPSQTVYSAGFLAGQMSITAPRPGPVLGGVTRATLGTGSPGPLDLRLDRRLGWAPTSVSEPMTTSLQSQIVGLAPGQTSETSSSIFGPPPARPLGAPLPGSIGRLGPTLPRLSRPEAAQQNQPGLPAPLPSVELDLQQPPGTQAPLGTPLEFVQRTESPILPLNTRLDPLGATRRPSADLTLGPVTEKPAEGVGPRTARTAEPESVQRLRTGGIVPGRDVFTDMQLGLALVANPGASWFAEMQSAIQGKPSRSGLLDQVANLQSQDFVNLLARTPIRTFHGQGPSPLNDELLKAESLMEIGQYYEAVGRYDAAHRIDPFNPLPLVGKGNALLAMGEYLQAAVALVQGFGRYPELSRFKLDLKSLMGGGEITDIRRADLHDLLVNQDDARLRFLLGYLEYYGGERESGLQNLERAAELDRGTSIISRFPEMLKEQGKLPPPQLPTDTPGALPAPERGPVPEGGRAP